jgi:hypothetical protein
MDRVSVLEAQIADGERRITALLLLMRRTKEHGPSTPHAERLLSSMESTRQEWVKKPAWAAHHTAFIRREWSALASAERYVCEGQAFINRLKAERHQVNYRPERAEDLDRLIQVF